MYAFCPESLSVVTTIKCKLLGLHFRIEINEITGVNQKYMLLASGLKPD